MSFPKKPNYTETQLIDASNTLRSEGSSNSDLAEAQDILKKWRAAHAYPINTFQSTLRDKVQPYKTAIVAQRLKRAPTIIGKLSRIQRLNLANMQDIGGVRAVLKTADEVDKLVEQYLEKGRLTHKLENMNDYIKSPKTDGYRGVHLIYRYNLNRPPSRDWNGLLIEMQFRTELQHYWATAVEVTGTILGEPFKFGGNGSPEWREFFKLVSCAFAHMEKRPVIKGYRDLTEKQIFKKVAEKENELDALQRMEYYSAALNVIRDKGSRNSAYHIISLDLKKKSVNIQSFTRLKIAKASDAYSAIEKRQDDNLIDTVLVSTAKSDDLKRAYPNYFLDVSGFSRRVRAIIATSSS